MLAASSSTNVDWHGLGFGTQVDGLAAMVLGQSDGFEESGDQRGVVALAIHRGGDVHRIAGMNELVHIEVRVDPGAQRGAGGVDVHDPPRVWRRWIHARDPGR